MISSYKQNFFSLGFKTEASVWELDEPDSDLIQVEESTYTLTSDGPLLLASQTHLSLSKPSSFKIRCSSSSPSYIGVTTQESSTPISTNLGSEAWEWSMCI